VRQQDKRVQQLIKIERFANRVLETLVTALFFAILSLTVVLVIMRYGFNAAIIGGNEAMEYMFIYTTAIGAAVSIGKGEHISITFLLDRFTGRLRRAINIFNYLLIAFINIVMIGYSIGWIQSAGHFESPVLRIPNWMVQVSVPIGAGLAAAYCLNHVLLEILNWNTLSEE
jgi:TRAP-type C4-dicarboxylate transport system permease small subunit